MEKQKIPDLMSRFYWLRGMPAPQNIEEDSMAEQHDGSSTSTTGTATPATLTIEAVQQLVNEQLQQQQQQFEQKLQEQQQQHEQQLASLQQQLQEQSVNSGSQQPIQSASGGSQQPVHSASGGSQQLEQLGSSGTQQPIQAVVVDTLPTGQPAGTGVQQPAPQVAYFAATQYQAAAAVTPEEAPPAPTFQYKPHVQLRRFNGKNSAVTWWCQFMAYISLHRMPVGDAIQSLHFYLEGAAETWFHTLDPIIKTSLETLKAAFMARFCPSSKLNLKMMDVRQHEAETVEDYFHRVTSSVADKPVDEDWLIHALVTGMKQTIKRPVVQADPQTLEQLRNEAVKAEIAEKLTSGNGQTPSERAQDNKLDTILEKINSIDVAAVQRNTGESCGNCGRFCHPQNCFARNQKCKYCNGLHHFWRQCRIRQRDIKNGKSGKLPKVGNSA